MELVYYYPIVEQLHILVRQGNTGTPKELAKKLGISRSELYMIIEELKELGFHIKYSKQFKFYYYEKDIHLKFDKLIEVPDWENINGGAVLYMKPTCIFLNSVF